MMKPIHIDIDHLLNLPGNFAVFWKDLSGTFLGCNEVPVALFGYQSQKDIIGRNEFDLPILKSEAQVLRDNDMEVIKQNKAIASHYTLVYKDEIRQIHSFKAPLYNQEGKIVGVYGIDDVTNCINIPSTVSQLVNAGLSDQHLSSFVNNIKLSKRQYECLILLAKGFSIKKIAAQVGISPRTVEDHIQIARKKFNCNTREELLVKLTQYNILECYDAWS